MYADLEKTRTDLQRAVLAFIQRERLLPPGHRVVIGVSGGPDSLCLLHLLWSHCRKLDIQIHIAHLNHLIRGANAEADARFVSDLAARWGVPCTTADRDVPQVARQCGLAIEEAARRVRYVFLAEVARHVGATHIAVGHNADDQSETVLMHWLRGAGLAGLRGMLPATPLADLRLLQVDTQDRLQFAGLWLVRPLLETPRIQIERYCRHHGLSPRFDRSNLDTTLYRNKLRHELLPHLESEYKPRFREILRRSTRLIRDDYELLCAMRDRAWTEVTCQIHDTAVVLDRVAWQALHPSLQRAILRQAVQHLRWDLRDLNYVHIEAAMRVAQHGLVGAQATLPRGILLTVGYTTLTLAGQEHVPEPDFPALDPRKHGSWDRLPLAVPGKTVLPGQVLVEIEIIPREALPCDWNRNDDPWLAYMDAIALGIDPETPRSSLYIRRRRPGDCFRPLGLAGRHKRVSDLLINAKVPARWRERIPLLVGSDDSILWVCGWRLDERTQVCDTTSHVITIRLSLEG